jgi:hypothetical protein
MSLKLLKKRQERTSRMMSAHREMQEFFGDAEWKQFTNSCWGIADESEEAPRRSTRKTITKKKEVEKSTRVGKNGKRAKKPRACHPALQKIKRLVALSFCQKQEFSVTAVREILRANKMFNASLDRFKLFDAFRSVCHDVLRAIEHHLSHNFNIIVHPFMGVHFIMAKKIIIKCKEILDPKSVTTLLRFIRYYFQLRDEPEPSEDELATLHLRIGEVLEVMAANKERNEAIRRQESMS